MTAYIITPEQHAQIVDAINAAVHGTDTYANSYKGDKASAALAMLRGAQQLRERIAGEIRPLMQKTDGANTDDIANRIHYPGCWDTAAYPTLVDALWECVEWRGCSTCGASK